MKTPHMVSLLNVTLIQLFFNVTQFSITKFTKKTIFAVKILKKK